MKNKGKSASLIVLALLVSLIVASIPQVNINQEPTFRGARQEDTKIVLQDSKSSRTIAFVDHVPIKINGNQEFNDTATLESWEGNGTATNPYIIESFLIDRDGDDGHCIDISNTDVHFIIRDCNLIKASASARAGISLTNVINGVISNNTFSENFNGIFLNGAGYATIENNRIDAMLQNLGIGAVSLNNSVITGNEVNGSIGGLVLSDAMYSEISHNIIRKALASGFQIFNSWNLTISYNDIIDTVTNGVYLGWSENNTFVQNNCSLNYYGFYFQSCSYNTIINCTFAANTNGIVCTTGVTRNHYELCQIRDSAERGIWIQSGATYNGFKWNTLRNSTIFQVFCDNALNVVEYNYYDNYTGFDLDGDGYGDLPHPHYGSAGIVDNHPLMIEPTYPRWNPTPVNQYLELGESLNYDLDVFSPVQVVDWDVSDSAYFAINNEGVLSSIGNLNVGTYPVVVTVTNSFGMSLEGGFSIIVDDTVGPIWISQIKNKTYAYGESIEFQMTAWDLAGIDRWTISNTDNFTLTESSYADTSIATIEGASMLNPGTYHLTITVYDSHDNFASAQFYVIVEEEPGDTTAPVWILPPPEVTIEYGKTMTIQVAAYDASGIDEWHIDGVPSFTIDETGVITILGNLEVAVHYVEVRAYDPARNYCSAYLVVTVTEASTDGTDTTTTPTQPVGTGDFGFLVSTIGIAIAVVALIMGIGAFLNTRKAS